MDVSKFKDVAQKLNVLRNYSFLIVPVVIAVIGILLFMPAQLIGRRLQKQIEDQSVSVGRRIKSLNAGAVAGDQWKIEQKYQQAFAEDVNQAAMVIKHSTQRELLSYKIFPEPRDTSTLIFKEFGQRYREGIERKLTQIDAHECPTQVEIARSLQRGALTSTPGREGARSTGVASEVDKTIIDALCKSRARSASVYTNPADIAGYTFWNKYEYMGMQQAIQDCWFWQIGYWVIEDVLNTIDKCNAGAKSVFESPVKRLLYIYFISKATTTNSSTEVRPSYIASADDLTTEPCTARLSNSDIDVMHFEVAVVLRSKEVLKFMKELCSAKEHKFYGFFKESPEQTYKHNQITILASEIETISPQEEGHEFYRYGDEAVVSLLLSGEYIFDKNGYDSVKPASLKKDVAAASEYGR